MGAYSNDTSLNILASYAYLGNDKRFEELAFDLHRKGKINLMIDSGAFTKHNAKSNFDFLTLNNYCNFLQRHKNECEKYVMLDVVGNESKSKANYEEMLRQGLNPMFVLTMYDNDMDYFRYAIDNNPDCCVAGGATTKGPWMIKRFQTAYKESKCKAQIHGLAYVTYPNMLQLPLSSVDSSTWKISALRFGSFSFFKEGLKSTDIKSIRKNTKVPPKLLFMFEKCGITLSEFLCKSNYRGNVNIQSLMSIMAYLEYQNFCYKRGFRLFLAVSSYMDLAKILYVKENINNLSYNEYKKIQ